MHSLVLAVAASVEAHAVEASSGPAGLLTKFGIEWHYVIWQFVSFAVLAGVLYQFAIKPILAVVDTRNAKIDEGLKNAAASAAKLAQAQQQAAEELKKAQAAGTKLIEEARKAAKELADREQKAATDRANELIAKAQQAIQLEHKKMLEDARGEIARLVVATTQRVLSKELSDFERARFNEAAARELNVV
ncbi:MAG: F0F1 ATP synthase subunit B [Opitutae bacterium]|nr:F0F1 ATP synthase subunit B [Opitutae bacterium]